MTVGAVCDDVDVELPLEPFLDDLHVQQAQKSAPEAEPQGHAALGLEDEAASFSWSLPMRGLAASSKSAVLHPG